MDDARKKKKNISWMARKVYPSGNQWMNDLDHQESAVVCGIVVGT